MMHQGGVRARLIARSALDRNPVTVWDAFRDECGVTVSSDWMTDTGAAAALDLHSLTAAHDVEVSKR